jgi:hypothetical protein
MTRGGRGHPNRINLYTARPGDIGGRRRPSNQGLVKPATLAIMNDHAPVEQPASGRAAQDRRRRLRPPAHAQDADVR